MPTGIIRTPPKQYYSGFDPKNIPNCVLWLDAADIVALQTSGGSVTSWKDKSASAVNITIGGTGGLTYSSVTKSVSTVVGKTSYFTVPIDIRKTVNANISMFIVYKWLGQATNQDNTVFWGADAPNAANRVQFFQFTSYSPNNYGYFLNNGYLSNSTSLNSPNLKLYELVAQTGVTNGTTIYFNGTATTTGTEVVNTPVSGNEVLYFGGGETSSIYPSYTQFNEIILYTRAVTTAERQQIEGYLANKWGLTLPTGHPFKSIPPVLRMIQPIDLDGCILWLDAQDNSSMTFSGSNITAWNDKSGSGSHFTAFSNPILGTASSRQVIDTVTNTAYFARTTYSLPTTYSIFTTGYSTISSTTNPTYVGQIYASPDAVFMLRSLNNGMYVFKGNRSIWGTNTGTYPAITSNAIWGVTNPTAAGTVTFYYNGVSKNTNSGVTNSTSDGLYIGTYGTNATNYSWRGYFGDVIIYNNGLSTSDRQIIEGYLAWKFNLQANLDTTHPFKLYPPLVPLFNPLLIPNCKLWLDAADLSSSSMTLSGSTITAWIDKSNGYSGASSGSPTIVTNYQNGLPAVLFNGSTQYFNFGNINNVGTTHLYIFVVMKFNSTANGGIVTKTRQNTLLGRYALFKDANTLIPLIQSSTTIGTGYADTNTTTRLITMAWNRATDVLYVNGTSVFSATLNDTNNMSTSDVFLVGAYANSSGTVPPAAGYYLNGYIMEVVQYIGVISTQQRQKVEGYLAQKWGLRGSLPTTHSYYKVRI